MPPMAREILDPANQRPFQLPLAMLLAEFQKIKGAFVLHRQLRLGSKLRRQRLVEISSARQRFFVALVLDLVDERVLDQPNFRDMRI